MQDTRNPIANALELRPSSPNPSIYITVPNCAIVDLDQKVPLLWPKSYINGQIRTGRFVRNDFSGNTVF